MLPALHAAVATKKREVIAKLLRADVDVNSECEGKLSALHLAATVESPQICQLLINAGAKVDKRARHGLTPLHVAALFESDDSADVLVWYKADPFAKTDDGYTCDRLSGKTLDFRHRYWNRLNMPVNFSSVLRPYREPTEDTDVGATVLLLRSQLSHLTQRTLTGLAIAEALYQQRSEQAAA